MRRSLIFFALLLFPGSAMAAGPWPDPMLLGPAGEAASLPSLSYAAGDGDGVAAWRITQEPVNFPQFPAQLHKRLVVGSAPVGGAPAPTGRTLSSVAAGPVAFSAHSTLSVRKSISGKASTVSTVRLGYSYGSTSTGAIGTLVALRTVKLEGAPVLAVSSNGSAAIAWTEYRSNRSNRVWLALREAGGKRFHTPAVIRGTGHSSGLAAAVNNRGQVVVAYDRNGTVEARVGSTRHGVSARTHTLGTGSDVTTSAAAVTANGRTSVAWTTQDGGEELNTPVTVRAAVLPAGRTSFRASTTLDSAGPGIERPDGDITMAAAEDGTTTVAYTLSGSYDELHQVEATPVRVATQDAHGVFGASVTVAGAAHNGPIAVRRDGAVVLPVVAHAGLDQSVVTAAVRPVGAPSFTVENVGTGKGSVNATAAFAGDRAVLLWTGQTVRYSARAVM